MKRWAGTRVFSFQFRIFRDAPDGDSSIARKHLLFSLTFFFVDNDEI